MARKIYRIDEFMGLDQSMGENGMAASYSPDACNMDTADGELTIAKGYTRYITSAVPGTEAIRRMFLFHSGSGDQVIVVTGGSVYAYREGVWVLIYTFTGGLTGGRVDFTEARIDATDYLLIASGEQQIVKYNGAQAALSNQLLIFKKRSLYRLIGDKPSNFTVERIDSDVETAAYTSLVMSGDMLYFMTKGGLCRFNGVSAALMPDARRIKKLLSGADVSLSKGAAARSRLYYSFDDAKGGGIIEYDLVRHTYMLRRGFDVGDIASWDGRLYIVNSGRYVCLFDDGKSYDGKNIEAWWRTPETDLFDKSGVKAMRSLCFRGHAQGAATAMNAEVSVGSARAATRVLLPTEESEVVEVPLKNEGRTFSLRIANEAGGRFTLRGGIELSFETWRRVE